MLNELLTYTRLLNMIAIKLGYDWLLLGSGFEPYEKKYYVVFGHDGNCDTKLFEANSKPVSFKYVDAESNLRSIKDIYHELVKLTYKTLESGGKLSDGKIEIDVSDVPEFMIECNLLDLS